MIFKLATLLSIGRQVVLPAKLLLTLMLLVNFDGQIHAQAPSGDFKIFRNSIVPLSHFGLKAERATLSEAEQKQTLQIHFALQTNNFDELEQRLGRGETISPDEMLEKYSGNKAYLEALVSWLRGQEFTIVDTSVDNTDVYAKGTVAQITKSLGVSFTEVTIEGVTTPAAITPPRLPTGIGQHVIAIDGLQPFIRFKSNIVPAPKKLERHSTLRSSTLAIASGSGSPLMVDDVLAAYNANGVGLSGNGQTIGILIDTFPAMSDLRDFWAKNGLKIKDSQIQFISIGGANVKLPSPSGEETLDAEWASGIAPGATVRVYAVGSLEPAAIARGFDRIYAEALHNSGLRQVSLSVGLREDDVGPDEIIAEHRRLSKLAAIGVTVFVSSGDAGSNPDHFGHGHGPDTVVEYEACDASAIGVGGTILSLDSQKRVIGETGWSESGGGASNFVSRPSWQAAYAPIRSGGRLVPDVSAAAAPGGFVVLNGSARVYAGTSWSTPVWAGFAALLAEARQKQHKPPIGFLAPVLYKLQSKGFKDIIAGSNGAYHAGPGWDPVTGLGVPDVKTLSAALP